MNGNIKNHLILKDKKYQVILLKTYIFFKDEIQDKIVNKAEKIEGENGIFNAEISDIFENNSKNN